MKADIHPILKPAKVACACGNVIETRSTLGDFKIDICSACHPFYTGSGRAKLLDAEGRVERFKRKYKRA